MIVSKQTNARLIWVWAGLVVATLVSQGIGSDTAGMGIAAGIAVLAIAYAKVRFVMREFMELRNAPKAMGYAADAWLCLSMVLLGGLYAWGGAI